MDRVQHLAYILVAVSVFVTLCTSKTLDIKIPDIYGTNVKDVETVVKEEEQRLRDLHENPEFEELRIIDDPLEIPKILAKPRNANGDVIEDFKPIPLPTDFDSYDVDPKDGRIHLSELITVTGAVENVEEAFNASDTDSKVTIKIFREGIGLNTTTPNGKDNILRAISHNHCKKSKFSSQNSVFDTGS